MGRFNVSVQNFNDNLLDEFSGFISFSKKCWIIIRHLERTASLLDHVLVRRKYKWSSYHDEHVGGRWLDLGAKVIVCLHDLLPHLAVAGPY